MFRRSIYKTPAQMQAMIEPGLITAAALDAIRPLIRPGVTTLELDTEANRTIRGRGAESNFQLVRGYSHTICVSVNEEVVHGIPSERVLQAGDIVSVDCGAQFQGWNGDSAITVVVPDPSRAEMVERREELSRVTEGSMWAGIAAMASARHLGDIGAAIQGHIEDNPPLAEVNPPLAEPNPPLAERNPPLAEPNPPLAEPVEAWGILREYVGHGIGRKMHEAPSVFNYRTPDFGAEVKPGLVLAIEPMVTAGSEETYVEDDDWTVSTIDGSDGAHWEHSVARHADGIWVLTAPDGGAAGLAPFGVEPVPLG